MSQTLLKPTIDQDFKPFQVLEAAEFSQQILWDIQNAKDFIFIKSFLWRNDEAGRELAGALLDAANRGVQIYIIKDKKGAVFEYGEGNGQSFFHDEPLTDPIAFGQSRIIRHYYQTETDPPAKNEMLDDFVTHRGIEALYDYKLSDHSKVIVIDGKISFTGGINFGSNEFHHQFSPDDKRLIDYMVRIEGKREAQALLKTLDGTVEPADEEGLDVTFIHEIEFGKARINQDLARFIIETRGQMRQMIAFHSEPEYCEAIAGLLVHGVPATLITPSRPSTNRYSNPIFLKKLAAISQRKGDLNVAFHPQTFHAKIVHDDERARLGSQNQSMPDGLVAETVIHTEKPEYVAKIKEVVDNEQARCEIFSGRDLQEILKERYPFWSNLDRIAIERTGLAAEHTVARRKTKKVNAHRKICRELIAKVLKKME